MGAAPIGRGYLAAVCVAIGTLAFLVLVLRLHLVLAAVLAVATYLGFSLLRNPVSSRQIVPWDAIWWPWKQWPANDIREATADEQAYAAAFEHARALRAVAHQIPKPLVRERVGLILYRVDQILTAMGDDQDMSQLPVLDTCVLEPLLKLLSSYLRLVQRGVQSGDEELARIESHSLTLIREAVDDFYERLHSRQVTDLAALSELIEFNLESVRAMMRRRTTP